MIEINWYYGFERLPREERKRIWADSGIWAHSHKPREFILCTVGRIVLDAIVVGPDVGPWREVYLERDWDNNGSGVEGVHSSGEHPCSPAVDQG